MSVRLTSLFGASIALIACMLTASPAAAGWTAPALVAERADVQFDFAIGADGTAAAAWERGGVQVAVKRPGRPWSTPRRVSDPSRRVGRRR